MNQELKKLIDEQKQKTFLPEFRDKVTDARALGVLISQHFKWDGLQILEAAFSALEDANFHVEATKVADMIQELK